MSRDEVKKILHIIVATYPNYKPVNMSETIDIWALMLDEYEYKDIAVALKKYILANQSGFAPSISQLVALSQTDIEMSEQEIWAMVYKAICNSNYNSETEFAKLPEIVQKAVGTPAMLKECAAMDMKSITVYQSQFLNSYRAVMNRVKTDSMLPPSMRIGAENAKMIGEIK